MIHGTCPALRYTFLYNSAFFPTFATFAASKDRDLKILLDIWNKVFKSGVSKFCGRQPLEKFKRYGLFKQTISLEIFKISYGRILQINVFRRPPKTWNTNFYLMQTNFRSCKNLCFRWHENACNVTLNKSNT